MSKFIQRPILLICLLFFLFVSLSCVSSATFNNTSTTEDIQDFINNGGSDNELILDGDFNNLSTLQINRSMSISGKNNAIITKNPSDSSTILFNITTPNIIIENLVINGYNNPIRSNSSNLTVRNNQIQSTGHGVYIYNNNSIENVKVYDNKFDVNAGSSSGIHLQSIIARNNDIYGNNITVNGTIARGIYIEAYSPMGYSGDSNNTNNNIFENNIKTSSRAYGIYLTGYTYNSKHNIYKNNITTVNNNGWAMILTSYDGIVSDNIIYGNIINTNGSSAYGIYLTGSSLANVTNNRVYDNIVETNGSYGDCISLSTSAGSVENNHVYNNKVKSKGVYGSGVYLTTYNGVVNNNAIFENDIENTGNSNVAIYFDSTYGNITNNSVYRNNISSSLNNSAGIYFYVYASGLSENNKIFSNNIIANGSGILVSGDSKDFNISHNRILVNGLIVRLSAEGINNLFSENWLGNNTPDMSKIVNINMNYFYTVNATAIKNHGVVGDKWIIYYTFYLNGTNDSGDYEKLPFFQAQLFNESGVISNRTAYNTGNWSIPINSLITENFTVFLDNEVIPLGNFTSAKDSTELNMGIIGESAIGKTVTINGVLKNIQGKALANKKVTLFVNGEAIASQNTDSNGAVSFKYRFDNEGNYTFQLIFEEEEFYVGAISNEITENVSNPVPPNPPTPDPPQSDPKKDVNHTNAKMKETGVSVIAVLFILLASLGLISFKKD